MGKRSTRMSRKLRVQLSPSILKDFDGLAIDKKTLELSGLRDGEILPLEGRKTLQLLREREFKADKVLYESVTEQNGFSLCPTNELLGFDHLIAVDTNTRPLAGSKVSVTAAYHVVPKEHDGSTAIVYTRVLALLEHWNVKVPPENLGWWQIIQAVDGSDYPFWGRIGVIVDSDLGNLEEYNRRDKPIFCDYVLPDTMTLIYASDKGASEYLPNRLLKHCHQLADDLLKQGNLVLDIHGIEPGIEGMFSHFRQWDLKDMTLRAFTDKTIQFDGD